MGSSISTDKHGTCLQNWLQIEDHLADLQFNATPNNHLMVWRVFMDQIDQSISTTPFLLDNINPTSAFSCDEAYVVGLTCKSTYEKGSYVDTHIQTLLSCLTMNINRKSLEAYVKKGVVEDSQESSRIQYFTYVFLGKRAKGNVKIAALCYSYKLAKLLSNYRRICIITGGGVYRNKKLQIGSVLPLCKNKNLCDRSVYQFRNIALVSELTTSTPNLNTSKSSSTNQDQLGQFSLFTYKLKPGLNPQLTKSKTKSFQQSQQDSIMSSISQNNPNSVSIPSTTQKSQNGPLSLPLASSSKQVHVPSIKPPMLKLALKPYQDLTYEQVDMEEKNMKFDIRATARHQIKMQKFSNDCSVVMDGLYLSGEKIAKDEEMLKKYKITEIVNCAGDYCLNWFESVRSQENPSTPKYNYLTFFLKDSQNENIECLFYKVIDFISQALSNRKNVLVHCIQGISRSVTFIIAYLIYTKGFDYKKAECFVKEKRGIACPNNGFMVELIQFYKRLHEKYTSLPSPRVFLVSYHCQETPDVVTARLIKQKLFESDGKKLLSLDQRGIYIIQTEDILYLWVGSKCEDQKKMKKFWNYAQSYIKKLQQNEKAPMKVKAIHQGNEGRQFLSMWGIQQLPKNYENPEYDRLFNEQKPTPKAGYLRKHYEREQDHVEEQFISRLFIYPDFQTGLGVFEAEDLSGLSLLVKSDNQRIKIFVWREEGWETQERIYEEFLDSVIQTNYASYSEEDIEMQEQEIGCPFEELSDEFISCFS